MIISMASELKVRRIPTDTLITHDNQQLLLTEDLLKQVANAVSRKTNKKLQYSDMTQLRLIAQKIPASSFYEKTISDGIALIATTFLNKFQTRDEPPTESVVDYLKEEVMKTTDDEHQYKFTSHPSRQTSSNPDHIDLMVMKARSQIVPGLQTFESIVFPHREIPFDSRNKDLSYDGLRWYLHTAGKPGRQGDIHIQDTLQQIIRMRIQPFWLPITNTKDLYYDTISMRIHEFFQHADVTEFLYSDNTIPTTHGYHFRFRITQKNTRRIYLEPENPVYTFSKPVAQLNTVTVSFRSPYHQIQLPTDYAVFTVTPGLPTIFTTTTNHHLETGDMVYVVGYTGNAEINDISGLIITRIDNVTFSVAIDTSADLPQSVRVYYGSKRIFFQIEFTSLEH